MLSISSSTNPHPSSFTKDILLKKYLQITIEELDKFSQKDATTPNILELLQNYPEIFTKNPIDPECLKKHLMNPDDAKYIEPSYPPKFTNKKAQFLTESDKKFNMNLKVKKDFFSSLVTPFEKILRSASKKKEPNFLEKIWYTEDEKLEILGPFSTQEMDLQFKEEKIARNTKVAFGRKDKFSYLNYLYDRFCGETPKEEENIVKNLVLRSEGVSKFDGLFKYEKEIKEKAILAKEENKVDRWERNMNVVEEKKNDEIGEKYVQKKEENKIERRIEERIEKKEENKIERRVEEKIEKKTEEKILKKTEEKIEKKTEEKIEKKTEEKIEKKPEEKIEKKPEEQKTVEKIEKKEAKTEEKQPNSLEKTVKTSSLEQIEKSPDEKQPEISTDLKNEIPQKPLETVDKSSKKKSKKKKGKIIDITELIPEKKPTDPEAQNIQKEEKIEKTFEIKEEDFPTLPVNPKKKPTDDKDFIKVKKLNKNEKTMKKQQENLEKIKQETLETLEKKQAILKAETQISEEKFIKEEKKVQEKPKVEKIMCEFEFPSLEESKKTLKNPVPKINKPIVLQENKKKKNLTGGWDYEDDSSRKALGKKGKKEDIILNDESFPSLS